MRAVAVDMATPDSRVATTTTTLRRPPGLLLARARLSAAAPNATALTTTTTRTARPSLATGAAARAPAATDGGSAAAAPRRRARSSPPPPTRPLAAAAADDAPEARKNPELYGAGAGGSGTTGAYAADAATTNTAASTPSSSSSTPRPLLLRRRKPEVLSPAGGWPQLKAAVENGADACYFGLQSGLNARARAANFAPEELEEVADYLHARGVKGYLALNVLVFDEELAEFESAVRRAAAAGVDALIVQDVGAQEVARRVAPGLPVHASTQMTITAPEGARFAASRGAKRVVVGRELSVREIAQVAAGSGGGGPAPSFEVEAFVHGALCVAYSGQCWSSEAWGGRSANRGQCAQQCRMPYALFVDGQVRELAGGERFLLSPQDLSGVEQVPALVRAGVTCLKIEGRLKGPEYVALATSTYRRAVDAAWEALVAAGEVEEAEVVTGGAGAAAAEAAAAAAAATAASAAVETPPPKRRGRPPKNKAGAAAAAAAPPPPPPPQTLSMDRLLAPVDGFDAPSAVGEQRLSDLRQLFSRGQDSEHNGSTPGFLLGSRHQRLVRGRAPRHRGLLVGAVRSVDPSKGRAVVEGCLGPAAGVKNGDGVVFDDGRADEDEPGGAVYGVRVLEGGDAVELQFAVGGGGGGGGGGGVGGIGGRKTSSSYSPQNAAAEQTRRMLRRVRPGDLVWKTKDHAAEQRARQSFESLPASATRRLPVRAACSGALGGPVVVEYTALDRALASVVVGRAETAVPLERAGKRPLTAADVRAAVGQLGDTTFALLEEEYKEAGAAASVDLSGLALEQGERIEEDREEGEGGRQPSRVARGVCLSAATDGKQTGTTNRGDAAFCDNDNNSGARR
jgi:collagenase-like PrtC family protease